MMLRKIKKIGVIAIVAMMVLTGCNGGNEQGSNQGSNQNDSQNGGNSNVVVSGKIQAGGSTSVEKAAKSLLEEFVALNPSVTYEYDATGSSTGINNVIDGTYAIGYSSRELKDDEKSKVEYKNIALDGIALAVNPNNSVKDLSLEQIRGIFTGEIKNWSEVGGKDANIVVVSRENGSGTRSAFEEISKVGDKLSQEAIIKSGNGEVAAYVAGEENAIGYVSFVTLEANKDKISGLMVEGVEAKVENVQAGSYLLSRPFVMVYKTENLTEADKAFMDFIFTEEGQNIIEEAGAIKVTQ